MHHFMEAIGEASLKVREGQTAVGTAVQSICGECQGGIYPILMSGTLALARQDSFPFSID